MNMVLTSVLLGLVVAMLGVIITCIVVIARRVRRMIANLRAEITAFVSAPDDKTPSPLALTVDQMSQLVARAIIVQAKTTFMGEASAVARHATAAAAQEATAKMPWLGLIASIWPGASKTLLKNPALLNFAASKMGGRGQSAGPSGPSSNGHDDQLNLEIH